MIMLIFNFRELQNEMMVRTRCLKTNDEYFNERFFVILRQIF